MLVLKTLNALSFHHGTRQLANEKNTLLVYSLADRSWASDTDWDWPLWEDDKDTTPRRSTTSKILV